MAVNVYWVQVEKEAAAVEKSADKVDVFSVITAMREEVPPNDPEPAAEVAAEEVIGFVV